MGIRSLGYWETEGRRQSEGHVVRGFSPDVARERQYKAHLKVLTTFEIADVNVGEDRR